MLRIKEIRKSKGLSQAIVAGKAGITQCHLSDIENKRRNPSIEVFIKLADALDCSLDEMVDRKTAS